MNDTVKLNNCPKCGGPIPTGAPQGLCPKCILLGAATATEAGMPATATSEIPSLDRVAAAFPQLEILELIGRGGMGFVFKARQPHLDRFVALKLLPDKLARDPRFTERFNREGRVLAKLNHPNIVSVYDFGQTEHFYFLTMEFVDGVNLRQAMKAGRFSPAEALAIVPKICEALQYAHGQGILHRDIKPENILLDARGQVKIADFGIAKLVGDDKPDVTLTGTGAALGTPHYMAPEQLEKPTEVDHRADIYSLGVVFYEMLTGELPIGRFAAPSSKTPVGANVDEVVFRTLEKDRERRYQSAGEMKTQVEHLTGVGVAAPALASADDFILCPPRLPRMAKAIILYALVAAPLYWLVYLFALPPLPEHALVRFTQGAVNVFSAVGEFLVLLVLAFGGWKLRGLRSSAAGWIKFGLWAHLGTIVLAFAAQIFVEVLANDVTPNAPATAPALSDGVLLALGLAAIAFEISALVWLRRHGALLKSFCVSDAAPQGRRGVLKWAFLGVLVATVGVFVARQFLQSEIPPPAVAAVDGQNTPAEPADTTPWIRFTFTAVELREVAGVRWLAIDYVDDVHGECQKSFPWETTIPGFKAETRASEFVKEDKGSPKVHHRRIEYRMPDSSPREQLERLRDDLERVLRGKSFRLELGENEVPLLLFELPGVEGGSLKARVKVVPQPKIPVGQSTASNGASGSIALTITRAEIQPENRKLRVFFDLDESPTLGIKADVDTIIKKSGVKFPALLPGTVSRVDGRSHVAEWVLPEFFDAARLTNAQWQVNFNHAGQRFQKRVGQVVTLVVLNQYATVGKQDDWEHVLLLRAVPLPPQSKLGGVDDSPSLGFVPAAPESKLVIDVWPGAYPAGVTPQPDKLRWKFKCLIPPGHLAQILFVRWTNGVPAIQQNQSAYYKVSAAPAEIDLHLSYDKHGPSQPAKERSQWNVYLGRGATMSTFLPEDPTYVPLNTPGRMTVSSGRQRSVPLVDFADPSRLPGRGQNGIDLRILLVPLKAPAIRAVPTEQDHGNYISGMGLAVTMEDALKVLKELPADP